MLSRSIAILIGTWLSMLAVILPLSPVHRVSALVAGIAGTLLSFASLSDDRARIGAALVGAWVALSPFILPSTLLEEVLTVSWGVTTFVCMIGPFSDRPRTQVIPVPAKRAPAVEDEPALPRAA